MNNWFVLGLLFVILLVLLFDLILSMSIYWKLALLAVGVGIFLLRR